MKKRAPSRIEELFAVQVRALRLPVPVRELSPVAGRRWRVDFAWPAFRLIVEIEGGVWSGGRHVRPVGFAGDCEKYNALALSGWMVLRFPGDQVESGVAVRLAAQAIAKALANTDQGEEHD